MPLCGAVPARVAAFLEFLDDLAVEGRNIVRLAAGDQALIDDDLRSTHSASAFLRSVLSDGHQVTMRPRTASASISVHGPWQIAPIGFLSLVKARTKFTARWSTRKASGLATPPGRTRASYSSALTWSRVLST